MKCTRHILLLSFILFFSISCDVFVKEENSEEGSDEVLVSWEGLYGGATDIYTREDGQMELDVEDTEVEVEVRFVSGSNEIDYFEFDTSSYYDSNLTDNPSSPNRISQDSLVLVDREGKYQTDYLIEKEGQKINGEVRLFEQNSDGVYIIISRYDFAASIVEK